MLGQRSLVSPLVSCVMPGAPVADIDQTLIRRPARLEEKTICIAAGRVGGRDLQALAVATGNPPRRCRRCGRRSSASGRCLRSLPKSVVNSSRVPSGETASVSICVPRGSLVICSGGSFFAPSVTSFIASVVVTAGSIVPPVVAAHELRA